MITLPLSNTEIEELERIERLTGNSFEAYQWLAKDIAARLHIPVSSVYSVDRKFKVVNIMAQQHSSPD